MEQDLLQDITIYHKENKNWKKYNQKASVRNTAYKNRNTTGSQLADKTLIRIFNIQGYKSDFNVENGDVIYLGNTDYTIIETPITELRNLYGKEKVIEVTSVGEFTFENDEIKELNHIKIGGK